MSAPTSKPKREHGPLMGAWVRLEPTVEQERSLVRHAGALDREDLALATWFAQQMSAPAPEPTDASAEDRVSNFEPLPYRRSRPRHARWHGASTMTRVPADV